MLIFRSCATIVGSLGIQFPITTLPPGLATRTISFEKDTYIFNFQGTPAEFVTTFRHYYGPTMNAFDAAEKNGRAADLQSELEDLFNRHNTSSRKDLTSIPATFLRVTVAV